MPWVMLLCTSLLAALINAVLLRAPESPTPLLYWFNGAMLLGYGLMLLFYGRHRQRVLAVWLPIKQTIARLALIAAFPILFLAMIWLSHRLATTTQCDDFNVAGRGHWIGWLLASLCEVTGPLLPTLLMLLVCGYAIGSLGLLVLRHAYPSGR